MSEPTEVVPEKFERKREYLLEDSGEDFEEWMEKEVGKYGSKLVDIDRVTMKAIARRSSQVKVLRFLLKHCSRDFSRKEIKNALEMPESTVHRALVKLVGAGVLERIVPTAIDKRFKCYRIANLKVVESIIKLHDRFVSFKFAKILPYDYISINNLKKNIEFLELCEKYKLTVDEGIETLKFNTRKVKHVYGDRKEGYVSYKVLIGFRRKEQ